MWFNTRQASCTWDRSIYSVQNYVFISGEVICIVKCHLWREWQMTVCCFCVCWCTLMQVDFVVFKFDERVYSFEFILWFHIEERRNSYLKYVPAGAYHLFSWNSLEFWNSKNASDWLIIGSVFPDTFTQFCGQSLDCMIALWESQSPTPSLMYVPQEGTYMFLCDSTFLDRLSCYPCYSNPEGNVLDWVCQTPRAGFGICYSKACQWDKRESAVAWLTERNRNRNITRI